MDVLVENQLIVELKRVEEIKGIHEAQVLTYRSQSTISVSDAPSVRSRAPPL